MNKKNGVVISWTNNMSKETGYVADIDASTLCFHNAAKKEDAQIFTNKGLATIAINKLIQYGEGENNTFTTEDV